MFLPLILLACVQEVDGASDTDDDNERHLVDEHRLAYDFGADTETMDRLAAGLDIQNADDLDGPLADVAALVACAAQPHLEPLSESAAHRETAYDSTGLAAAKNLMKEKSMKTMFAKPCVEPYSTAQRRLVIDRNDRQEAQQARVVLLTDSLTNKDDGITETIIPCGQSPPYVLLPLDQKPSQADTVSLHGLCDEQSLAFRIIMAPLEAAMRGERLQDVPQLLFAVLGTAGKHYDHLVHDKHF
jgi:hypothetical protein